MRLFIAIELPEAVRAALARVQQTLRARADARLRWARPDTMHITLKFLGNVDGEHVRSLTDSMSKVAAQRHPFTLSLARLGVFPEGRRPQVVWAGLEGDLAALVTLRDTLESALAADGYATEVRAFRPHVTLGRARDGMRPDEAERISASLSAMILPETPPFRVERIQLYRSLLGAGGSRYEALASARLSQARRQP